MSKKQVCKWIAVVAVVTLGGVAGYSDNGGSLNFILPATLVLTSIVVGALWIGGYFHER